jgi:protein-disulfide isomerase
MKEIAEYPGAWAGGNLAGDVTLVEFLDYRCGWCRRAFPEIEDLVESDGNIRFVIRELPVQGDESILAARFALAVRAVAGDDAYKRLHDDLMTFTGPFTEASLSRIAERNQIDPAPALARLDDPEITRILQDTADLAGRLRIEGTPAFVLDDRLLRGYAPLPQMRALVDEARRD